MSAPTPRSTRLLRSPAVLHDGQWWLVSTTGTILVTDPVFTGALDRFSKAVAAADLAVAEPRAQSGSSTSGAGIQR